MRGKLYIALSPMVTRRDDELVVEIAYGAQQMPFPFLNDSFIEIEALSRSVSK